MYSVLLLDGKIVQVPLIGLKTPGLDSLTRGTVDQNKLDRLYYYSYLRDRGTFSVNPLFTKRKKKEEYIMLGTEAHLRGRAANASA